MTRNFTVGSILIVTLIVSMLASLYELQPWRDVRFRPSATRKYNAYCSILKEQLLNAGSDNQDFGTYFAISSRSARCVSFGKNYWICEGYQFRHLAPDLYDRSFGTLTKNGCRLVLAAEFPTDMVQPELQIIRWGDRHYLLPDSEIEVFQAAIQNGIEPRTTIEGEFLLKDGDEQVPVDANLSFRKYDLQ